MEVMTPESSEGRERIARLEGQIEDVERQVDRNERTFGPLPLAVERLQWTIDAINTRLDKRDREDEARFEKLTRSFESQFITCSDRISKLSDGIQADREKREAQARQDEKDAQQGKVQRLVARYGAITALTVVLISSLTSLVIAFFGGP